MLFNGYLLGTFFPLLHPFLGKSGGRRANVRVERHFQVEDAYAKVQRLDDDHQRLYVGQSNKNMGGRCEGTIRL